MAHVIDFLTMYPEARAGLRGCSGEIEAER